MGQDNGVTARCEACLMPVRATPTGLGLYCICEEIAAEMALWQAQARAMPDQGRRFGDRMHAGWDLVPMQAAPAPDGRTPVDDPWAAVRAPREARALADSPALADARAKLVEIAAMKERLQASVREQGVEGARWSSALLRAWLWTFWLVAAAAAIGMLLRGLS